jgi:mannose-1-phosphate guanylyltransferase
MSGLRAIVLVGGEGTRLRPLTYTRPKPMLPVVGISIIERKLEHLHRHGVTEAVLSLGYKPDAFKAAFPTGECHGVRLLYAIEPSPLDTAGAILFAANEAGYHDGDGGGPIVVVNGDVITELDLTAQLAFHAAKGAEATIALTRVEDPSAFGVVPTDADGRVLAFVEKPPRDEAPTDWINAGAYVLEPSVLARIPAGRKVSIERETFPIIAAEGRLYAVQSPAYWIDTGTPVLYLQATRDLLAGTSHIGEGASVDPTAEVQESVIGADSTVGAHARIIRSVLLPGAVIGERAVVEDSIVGEEATVGARAKLSAHTVLGDRVVVPADVTRISERLANPVDPA